MPSYGLGRRVRRERKRHRRRGHRRARPHHLQVGDGADLSLPLVLADRAGEFHHVAQVDVVVVAVEDEHTLRGRGIRIHCRVLLLEVEAAQRGAGALVVPHHDAAHRHRVAHQGRGRARSLHVVNRRQCGSTAVAAVAAITAVASGARRGVGAQPVERVAGECLPLDGGVKGVGRVGVARADARQAPQRVVGSTAGPLRAGVHAHLAEGVDRGAVVCQDQGVVAVEQPRAGGEVGLGEDRCVGARVRNDVDVSRCYRAGQVERHARRRVAVRVLRQAHTARGRRRRRCRCRSRSPCCRNFPRCTPR